jgi:hypothetical protein
MTRSGDVSRRELLAGIGMTGAAIGASAVGHSTASALLGDGSQFGGNVLTAGEVDLSVAYDAHYDSVTDGSDGHTAEASGTVDGDPIDPLAVEAIKPGDSGRIALCPEVVGNPAYLWLCGTVTRSEESDGPAPQGDAEPSRGRRPVDGPGGELEDAIRVRLAYVPSGDEGAASTVPLLEGTFAQVLGALRYGLPLDADPNDDTGSRRAFAAPGEQACFEGSEGSCVELEWRVPRSVGNDIVSDELGFDLVFQRRGWPVVGRERGRAVVVVIVGRRGPDPYRQARRRPVGSVGRERPQGGRRPREGRRRDEPRAAARRRGGRKSHRGLHPGVRVRRVPRGRTTDGAVPGATVERPRERERPRDRGPSGEGS